jgi:hypothetical protein
MSEFEMWLPLDRDLVSRADWSVRPTPWLIAEPAPEPPEPEVPVWFTEGVAAPPRRRRRRRKPLFLLTAAAAVCILALGGAAYVAELLPLRTGEAGPEPDGVPRRSPAVVVSGPDGQRFACTLVGTPDGDRLLGTEDRDVICGLGGADRLEGNDGADVLLGGDGDDTLVGGPDPDRLYGEAGRDELDARDGFADRLDGGPGRDSADSGWLDDSPRRVESFDDRVLVAAGDIACDPETPSYNGGLGTARRCHHLRTGQLVEAIEPDVVLVLGDAQYEDARYSKYLQSYDPTWGRFKEITYPTVGRAHDAFGRGGYYRYWGERAGPRGSLWYSFDRGGWHLVSLNSNCVLAGGCDAGSPQELWLRADLAASQRECTLAFWSEPLFSSSRPRSLSLEPLWQTLYEFGVEIVLNGDAHNYERFRPLAPNGARDPRRGIRQFIVGTGGKSHVPFDRVARGSLVRDAETFGVLTLRLRQAGYEWEFVPEEEGGFTDAGSGTCH